MLKLVVVGLLVAASSAQICCNLDQECKASGLRCDTNTQCYTDPRFLYICGGEDPLDPWIDDGWSISGEWAYKYFPTTKSYSGAQSDCEKYIGLSRGSLAAVVLREPRVVSNIYDQKWLEQGVNGPWIGYKLTAEGKWRWYDGGNTNPATTSWAPNEPNNSGGILEGAAHIWTSQPTMILLNDSSEGKPKPYICEVHVTHMEH